MAITLRQATPHKFETTKDRQFIVCSRNHKNHGEISRKITTCTKPQKKYKVTNTKLMVHDQLPEFLNHTVILNPYQLTISSSYGNHHNKSDLTTIISVSNYQIFITGKNRKRNTNTKFSPLTAPLQRLLIEVTLKRYS